MNSTRHARISTTLGDLLAVVEGDALIGLYFPGHRYPPEESKIGATADEGDPVIGITARQVREYLAGEREEFELIVRTNGDEFSERVWTRLREIPRGSTTTYGTIASELGDRNLAQRVGQAVGRNPVSIVIPCHRVVGADGSLTGFAGGLERKRALLILEEPAEAAMARLF